MEGLCVAGCYGDCECWIRAERGRGAPAEQAETEPSREWGSMGNAMICRASEIISRKSMEKSEKK